jgi:hypothetical protein
MARTNAPQPLDNGGTVAAATSQRARIQPNSTVVAPVGFVPPPVTAPFQTCDRIAPVASGGSARRRCAFWPVCNNDAASCGGHRKSACKYYGRIGTQSDKRPSTEQINEARKKDKHQTRIDRSCAWYPICTKSTAQCDGIRREQCTMYGKNGAFPPPTNDEVDRARRIVQAKRRAATRRDDTAKRRKTS